MVHLAADEGVLGIGRVGAGAAGGVLTPEKHDAFDVAKPPATRPETQDEVVVLRPAAVPVAADCGERVAADDERRVRQGAFDEHVARRGLRGHEAVDPALVPARALADRLLREVGDAAPAGGQLLVGEGGDLRFEPLRESDVVSVHPRDQAASGERAGPLERGHEPRALLPEHPEARVGARVLGRDLGRAVRRAVVDDERLEVRERLRRERGEGFAQERGLVADRQEDGDERAAQLNVSSASSMLRAPSTHARRERASGASGHPKASNSPLVRTARTLPSQR